MRRVSRVTGAVHAEVDGSLIVLNPATSEFVQFNSVAAAIWEAVGTESADVDAVIAQVLGEFDVDPARGRAAIEVFVREALDSGLLEAV